MDIKKKKYAYWMYPSMVEEIEEMMAEANVKSKSEFVCSAVDFYIGYLRQKKCVDFISPILAQTIKSEIRSTERNVSEMLFKVAVEQAINSNIIAAVNEIDSSTLSHLRNNCGAEVARMNGLLTFEDAYDWQKG